MAVTKIWKVKNNLPYVINYAKDATKTVNSQLDTEYFQTMRDVMEYAIDDIKTEKQYFVSGLNCLKEKARDEMMLVKERFNKKDGILAWHGYQSFKEGEVDAKTAHEIGVKLAKELWSDYQVIVATHLNTHCYHNHFVVNSVSFKDGKKFNGCKASYRKMREVSDKLCQEYGLSVVKEHSPDYPKYFTEWEAKNEGTPTWRSAIREDVDKAIEKSISFNAFIRNLCNMGYGIKTGVKHIAVKPLGKERYVRLRSLGGEYTEESIRERILRQRMPERKIPKPKIIKARYTGTFHLSKRITWNSIRGLYYYFLHLLKRAEKNNDGLYLLRDELRHMDKLSKQAKFLNVHRIDTVDELRAYKAEQLYTISELEDKRRNLRNEIRRVNVPDKDKSEYSSDIKNITTKLQVLRKEVKLCEVIVERSKDLKIKKEIIQEERLKALQTERTQNKQLTNIKRQI